MWIDDGDFANERTEAEQAAFPEHGIRQVPRDGIGIKAYCLLDGCKLMKLPINMP